MPTYEYQCRACGHRFELFQSITDRPRRKCPRCGANKTDRLIGPGGALLFKGSGFHITDYRSKEFLDKARQESQGQAADKPTPSTLKETKTADVDR